MKNLSIVFIISLFIFGCNECRKGSNDYQDEYELWGCDSISLDYDTSMPEESSSLPSCSCPSRNVVEGHSGTSPDDAMFGFDYYDDEDDAYEMDRNQIDAYPDDW